MAKTDPINTANPAGPSDRRDGDDYIRALARAVVEILQKDHYTGAASPYNEDAAGEHAKLTLRQASKPANVADKGFLYTKDVSGTTELFYEDEAGNEVKLTIGGLINLTSAALLGILSNNTYFNAKDAAGTGVVSLIKANASDLPEILVGAVLSADTAPATDAAIANKKYVDDFVDKYTPSSYTGEESITFPNGLIIKKGTESVAANTTDTVEYASPFSSGCTPLILCSYKDNWTGLENPCAAMPLAGSLNSKLTVTNGHNATKDINWMAIGY